MSAYSVEIPDSGLVLHFENDGEDGPQLNMAFRHEQPRHEVTLPGRLVRVEGEVNYLATCTSEVKDVRVGSATGES